VTGWTRTVTLPAVTRTDLVRYAGASGDLNPIHHDDDYAKAAGAGGVFAMGMYPVGVAARVIADVFGHDSIRQFRARFEQRVWPGDRLVIDVRQVDRADGVRRLELDIWRAEGSRAARCWASVIDDTEKEDTHA